MEDLTQKVKNLEEINESLKKELEQQQRVNKGINQKLRCVKNTSGNDKIEERFSFNEILQSDIQIMRTGSFHGNEIKKGAENLEWYGLIKQGEKYILKKVRMDINSEQDVIVDRTGESTGKKVTTTDLATPIILINGLKDIQEGEILSVELKKSILYPGENMSMEFNGDWISISAYGIANPEVTIRNYMLQVSSKNDRHRTKQIFAGTNGFDDSMFKFIWAGDIDRDGKLDLIMDLSDHYNVKKLTLFLSSKAEEGELFKRIAEFKNTGC
jgi:hypothetical protein